MEYSEKKTAIEDRRLIRKSFLSGNINDINVEEDIFVFAEGAQHKIMPLHLIFRIKISKFQTDF